jgi:uncharacterized repeat protein (TIGR01451 family)
MPFPWKLSGPAIVPPATTYVAASLQGPAAYDPVLNRFVWDGALGSGESIVVTYQLLVNGATAEGTTVRNVAHLNDESGLTIDRVAVSRVNAPDLSMSDKSARTFNASPGQVLTYTLALRNDGLRPAEAHLVDPVPLHTVYLPGRAWASSGLLTPAEGILVWDGSIPVNQVVTITFPVVISPSAIGGYVFNRATLEDGWGSVIPLEAYTWTEARLFMPLVFKSD